MIQLARNTVAVTADFVTDVKDQRGAIRNSKPVEFASANRSSSPQHLIRSVEALLLKLLAADVTDRQDSRTPSGVSRGGRGTDRADRRCPYLRARCAQFRRLRTRGRPDGTAAAWRCGARLHPTGHNRDRGSTRDRVRQLLADY